MRSTHKERWPLRRIPTLVGPEPWRLGRVCAIPTLRPSPSPPGPPTPAPAVAQRAHSSRASRLPQILCGCGRTGSPPDSLCPRRALCQPGADTGKSPLLASTGTPTLTPRAGSHECPSSRGHTSHRGLLVRLLPTRPRAGSGNCLRVARFRTRSGLSPRQAFVVSRCQHLTTGSGA